MLSLPVCAPACVAAVCQGWDDDGDVDGVADDETEEGHEGAEAECEVRAAECDAGTSPAECAASTGPAIPGDAEQAEPGPSPRTGAARRGFPDEALAQASASEPLDPESELLPAEGLGGRDPGSIWQRGGQSGLLMARDGSLLVGGAGQPTRAPRFTAMAAALSAPQDLVPDWSFLSSGVTGASPWTGAQAAPLEGVAAREHDQEQPREGIAGGDLRLVVGTPEQEMEKRDTDCLAAQDTEEGQIGGAREQEAQSRRTGATRKEETMLELSEGARAQGGQHPGVHAEAGEARGSELACPPVSDLLPLGSREHEPGEGPPPAGPWPDFHDGPSASVNRSLEEATGGGPSGGPGRGSQVGAGTQMAMAACPSLQHPCDPLHTQGLGNPALGKAEEHHDITSSASGPSPEHLCGRATGPGSTGHQAEWGRAPVLAEGPPTPPVAPGVQRLQVEGRGAKPAPAQAALLTGADEIAGEASCRRGIWCAQGLGPL